MIEVFAIVLWLGVGDDRVMVENNLHYRNIDQCLYVARALTARFTSYAVGSVDHATAYCLPKMVKDTEQIY